MARRGRSTRRLPALPSPPRGPRAAHRPGTATATATPTGTATTARTRGCAGPSRPGTLSGGQDRLPRARGHDDPAVERAELVRRVERHSRHARDDRERPARLREPAVPSQPEGVAAIGETGDAQLHRPVAGAVHL